MSVTGQLGHVAFAKQIGGTDGFGAGNPVSNAANFTAVKITGDSLVSNNNPLTAEGEIGAGRDVSAIVPGGFQAAGALNGNLRARAASVLLEAAMGARVTGGGFDTFNVANDLSTYTIQKRVGSATPQLMVLNYTDAVVNTLNISCPSGALSTFSAGVIASGEQRVIGAESTPTVAGGLVAPTYASTSDDLLVFHGGRIMIGDTGTTVARDETFQSVEVVINNNIAADEYTIRPSRFLRTFTEGIRSIEANMTLVFENPDKYAQYVYGAKANVQPSYSLYNGALQLFLGNFQLLNDAQDAVGSTLAGTTFVPTTPNPAPVTGTQVVQMNIPRLVFTGFPVALSTSRIVVTTSARALVGGLAGAVPIMTAFVRPNGA